MTYQRQLLRQRRILFRLVADLEIRVRLARLVRILVPEPPEVLSRHGIDDVEIDLAPDLGVFVEDRVVCQTLVDAHQTVEETAHVGDSSCETEAATGDTVVSSEHSSWDINGYTDNGLQTCAASATSTNLPLRKLGAHRCCILYGLILVIL